jgi:hypothetical protein
MKEKMRELDMLLHPYGANARSKIRKLIYEIRKEVVWSSFRGIEIARFAKTGEVICKLLDGHLMYIADDIPYCILF